MTPAPVARPLACNSGEGIFGPHGGKQMRSPRYFICGCDAAYCENHAVPRPLGPTFEVGAPRHCPKHRSGLEGK